jgi:uncharacterized membrane protein YccC
MLGANASQERPLMIAEAAAPSRSVPDAVEAVRHSLDRVRMNQRGYARVRLRASAAVVTRARTDWGLAVLEWIEASVAQAEAEDARDPARAASDSRSRRITVETGPVRGRIEASWRRYQQVRKNGGPDQIARARAQWREALVDWFQALAGQRAAEDGQRTRERRPEPEQAAEPLAAADEENGEDREHWEDGAAAGEDGTAAGEAGPPAWEPAGRPRPTRGRGQPGYQPLAAGWTPARRAPGS